MGCCRSLPTMIRTKLMPPVHVFQAPVACHYFSSGTNPSLLVQFSLPLGPVESPGPAPKTWLQVLSTSTGGSFGKLLETFCVAAPWRIPDGTERFGSYCYPISEVLGKPSCPVTGLARVYLVPVHCLPVFPTWWCSSLTHSILGYRTQETGWSLETLLREWPLVDWLVQKSIYLCGVTHWTWV